MTPPNPDSEEALKLKTIALLNNLATPPSTATTDGIALRAH